MVQLEGVIASLDITWLDGQWKVPPFLPRAFVVNMVLERQLRREFKFSTRFRRETTYRTVGGGEDFEDLAMARYRDPYIGILLRRTNPDVSVLGLRPGDTARMLDDDDPRILESVEPVSPALLGDVEELLQRMAEERLALRGAVGVQSLWEDLKL